MAESDPLVVIKHLTKAYREVQALDDCSLTIQRGSIYGLLGPNGAGKTTLIRTLLGYIRPTSGSALIDGCDCHQESLAVRERVAYLPAEAKLFRMMRGRAVLEFFGQVHPRSTVERGLLIAERLKLDLRRRVAFMSTGMRQKLAIACVMACQAKLLILDEPTAALDPSVRKVVLSLIQEARDAGATILFSSHIFSEIEEVCDQAAIMNAGSVATTLSIERPTIENSTASSKLKEAYEACFASS
jgi:ABC-2 type transport system ATP-binding protein